MKSLARFVRRDSDDANDGLLLGTLLKSGDSVFKRGHVYEIIDVFGEIIIKDIGESCIPKDMTKNKFDISMMACWGSCVSTILDAMGKFLVFTYEEMKEYLQKKEKDK